MRGAVPRHARRWKGAAARASIATTDPRGASTGSVAMGETLPPSRLHGRVARLPGRQTLPGSRPRRCSGPPCVPRRSSFRQRSQARRRRRGGAPAPPRASTAGAAGRTSGGGSSRKYAGLSAGRSGHGSAPPPSDGAPAHLCASIDSDKAARATRTLLPGRFGQGSDGNSCRLSRTGIRVG